MLEFRPIWIIPLFVLLASCGGTKHLQEQAQSLEDAGLYKDALEAYRSIYLKDPDNTYARIGAHRNAQSILNEQLNEVSIRERKGDHRGAIEAFDDAIALKNGFEFTGIPVEIPVHFQVELENALRSETERLYASATVHVKERRFEEAENDLHDLLALDPTHKEAEYLMKVAELESLYLQGKKAEELGYMKRAHQLYTQIVRQDVQYKDALNRKRSIEKECSYTLAFVPLHTNEHSAMEAMEKPPTREMQVFGAAVKEALFDLNDPLIRIVDRDKSTYLLDEQRRSMSDIYADNGDINAGELLGAQYLLTGKILQYSRISKTAQYLIELTDTNTGQIHLSEKISFTKHDYDPDIGIATEVQITEFIGQKVALHLASFDATAP